MTAASPERTRLTADAIVEAADKIVRLAGTDALSMRTLATTLGVSTMAAHRHVSGKDHLVALVLERRFGGVPSASESPTLLRIDDLIVEAADALRDGRGLERELTVQVLNAHPDLERLARWRTCLLSALAGEHIEGVALALVSALAQEPSARRYVRFAARELAAPAQGA